MKRVLTALAALAAIFVVAGCNDYGNTFQANTGAAITTLSPSNITAGSAAFTLTINGTGFVTQTYITWNGTKLATSDITDTAGDVLQVYATVPASLVTTPGKALILTHNPYSGAGNNGLSNPLNFIINPLVQPNPVPLLQSISPTNVNAGSPAFTMTLTGADFVTSTTASQAASVSWNVGSTSTPLTILSENSTQITVTVPANLVATAGTATVTVLNPPNTAGTPPAGGGGLSGPLAFTINAAPAAGIARSSAKAAAEETPALSADGRYVAYTAGDGTHSQIYLRDTCEGAPVDCVAQTSLLSLGADGSSGNDDSHSPSMSADGRYVAFASAATNLLAATSAANGRQIYLRDTCAGAPAGCVPATQLVSTDATGQLVGTESILPSVSASGRFVAFVAVARSAAAGAAQSASSANSGYRQIFVRDTCLGAANCTAKTSRISLQPGDGSSSVPLASVAPPGPAVSANAKKVALDGGGTATLFTRSIAVDDRVFVAALQAAP
jgi:hypothetical protein